MPRPDERRERQRLEAQRRLGREDQPALGQPVGERARDDREEEHGRELEGADEPELEGRVGQLEHEPRLRDRLHPRPDQRDELPRPEDAEVTVVEGAEPAGKGHE